MQVKESYKKGALIKMKRFFGKVKHIQIYAAYNFTAMMCVFTLVAFILKLKTIPYLTIAELIIISLICATLQWLAFSDDVFKRLAYKWRIVIFMIPLLGVLTSFAVKFKWFPVDDTRAWVIFITIFLTCLLGCIICFEIYYRSTGNKYNGLLKEYRKRQGDREVKGVKGGKGQRK